MAKQQQDLSQDKSNTFIKGLNKDSDPSFVQEGMWTHARNATNNTFEGDLGTLSNESSNKFCVLTAPTVTNGSAYIIGSVHLYSDKWILFTAIHGPDQTLPSINSEIGLFEEGICRYRPIVLDPCLNLSKWDLITGAAREKEDCTLQVYWADGLNPDRYLNVGDPQTWPADNYVWQGDNTYANPAGDVIQWPGVIWQQICTDSSGTSQTSPGVWPTGHPVDNSCITCENTTDLDCDGIRLARLMKTPCIHVSPGKAGGTLRNGSYMATLAYSIKGQKVTDWFSLSNVQPIWLLPEPQGALELDIEADNDNFDEFILVIVQNINQGAVAKQIGIYSTSTTKIYIDQIKEDLISVPVAQLPIQTTVFEKSDIMLEVNNYLLRVGPTSKFDFNYQPLANLITTNWVSTEYPANYYTQGGYKPSYLRDEVYAFFIRWVYNTGDKSSVYHIPGRKAVEYRIPQTGQFLFEDQVLNNFDSIFAPEKVFEVYNTATGSPVPPEVLDDGGVIIGRGPMAYWESSENYPDNKPEVWNASEHCWTGKQNDPDISWDLCGLPIRHHKFPENIIYSPNGVEINVTQHFYSSFGIDQDPNKIRLLGVEFNNIILPKDNQGNDIPGIVGYEILRGSREGNKSIIAKGMINNLRPYNLKIDQINVAQPLKGLYPNHPFNTITTLDPSSGAPLNPATNGINDPYIKATTDNDVKINYATVDMPRNITTFHSPDTNFRTPFLSATELKLYGFLKGSSEQYFIEPNEHPQHKMLKDLTIFAIFLGGLVEGLISLIGKRTLNQPNISLQAQYSFLTAGGNSAPPAIQMNQLDQILYNSFTNIYNNNINTYLSSGASLLDAFTGGNGLYAINQGYLGVIQGGLTGASISPYTISTEIGAAGYLGIAGASVNFLYYFSEGADITLRAIYTLVPYRQYALQMLGHGFYKKFLAHDLNERRRFRIEESFYLRDTIQELPPYVNGALVEKYRVNNLKRQNSVIIRTTNNLGQNGGPHFILSQGNVDQSLVTIGTAVGNLGDVGFSQRDKIKPFTATISSHYGGLKLRIQNQYGQLDSIKQIPVTPCEQKLSNSPSEDNYPAPNNTGIQCSYENPDGSSTSYILEQKKITKTPVFFGGDTYISRYTEKNVMLFFYDWLFGQPDGTEFNYYTRQLIPEPRFWINSEKYDISNLVPTSFGSGVPGTGPVPSSYYQLDNDSYNYATDQNGLSNIGFGFTQKDSYFYLATSVVRDFFVESDIIVDFRIDGLETFQKSYNPYTYTDLQAMFNINPDTIERGNYYAYDYSLAISKLFTQYFSQGNLQSRYYDPEVSKLCYTYYPDRIIYSLPQQDESAKDSWFVYLVNNYKEFKDQISGVKNFAKTGIFITFKNSSPLAFQGVDQLQTDFGTKITIGDGGLFAQTPQSIVIADKPFEYGSSQDSRSVISTPAGLFYVSQNQGKIFAYAQGLTEISQSGMKWWFNNFLPFKLLEDFPEYPHIDNPVAGVGCQSNYDNENSVLYFTKKDYKLRDDMKGTLFYDRKQNKFFIINSAGEVTKTFVELSDPVFFEDASWTISYDPKTKFWISFHDWHPSLFIPTKNTFCTTVFNQVWKHNANCDDFCNFYGINYPFEIEFPFITGQTVTTTRSMEYILECYKRAKYNCIDQFHVLDFNFDKAVVFNSEQVSGYLNLNLFPKNNVTLSLDYPQVNLNDIDILFSKEENKYRFNQFWDITKDRGEFPVGSDYPPTGPLLPNTTILDGPYEEQNIWITAPNGYSKILNPNNLDYQKPELQRKRFRHYLNFLNLTKTISGDTNMIVKIMNVKNTYSPR
jgi:hypothetical protein